MTNLNVVYLQKNFSQNQRTSWHDVSLQNLRTTVTTNKLSLAANKKNTYVFIIIHCLCIKTILTTFD